MTRAGTAATPPVMAYGTHFRTPPDRADGFIRPPTRKVRSHSGHVSRFAGSVALADVSVSPHAGQ